MLICAMAAVFAAGAMAGCSSSCDQIVKSGPLAPAKTGAPLVDAGGKRISEAWAESGLDTPAKAVGSAKVAALMEIARSVSVSVGGWQYSEEKETAHSSETTFTSRFVSQEGACVRSMEFRGVRVENTYFESRCQNGNQVFDGWARVAVPKKEVDVAARMNRSRSVLLLSRHCEPNLGRQCSFSPDLEQLARNAVSKSPLSNLDARTLETCTDISACAQAMDAAWVIRVEVKLNSAQHIRDEFYAWASASLEVFEGRDGKSVLHVQSDPSENIGAYQEAEADQMATRWALENMLLRFEAEAPSTWPEQSGNCPR